MKPSFYRLRNGIKNYAWGSRTALNTLFGVPNPDEQPQAEMWMGAHPAGCSEIETGSDSVSLLDAIAQSPESVLGARAMDRFGQLPYLLKILAAETALSIQVHPDKRQAEEGYAQQGNRVGEDYNDANHKPELVYAITPFMAMNGFRPFQEIVNHFLRLNAPELMPALAEFRGNLTGEGFKHFFVSLMQLTQREKENVLTQLQACLDSGGFTHLQSFITRLMRDYPGDIGILAPLFLHCITLAPGEAMFLRAGTLHAYVHGTAVEVMACSDNVLRAGLTPKKINLPELVKCTVFRETQEQELRLFPDDTGTEQHYSVPVEDFCFSVIGNCQQKRVDVDSAQILLVLSGITTLRDTNGDEMTLSAGQSVFIPALTASYSIIQNELSCLVQC
ncbi:MULTISPECIES: mannose-6-phosphate isomerase, class I [Enterobacteriaceae]|jgi:mannose-6-phosphate isomerase|uniref:mannose-6-phosphate isomerase, class I n=1 Tax=Enterobacteriaceae TaxID=543 RepID=UPI000E0E5E0D|nr:mannose-6-phosphate isomerase, class I [Kluyvera ascorbata]ELY3448910.1 mannose-6-phosphate isomerase, class I [Cronobacter sakazakii]MBY5093746.1 mannose-6-phosphate isomerase, class I [Citrobacter freundii]HBR1957921.1 mannose-6-phosphate isomerase, class I [Klebsiella quasipneumoniae subsp. quasipneumoniae]HCC8048279.1 mannose-6-phosphate isomerase, class I [Enterobacter cloacae]HDG7914620.1 mannose-6-phosphate isomerase, class I [Klebsiella quasipneumoniae]